VIKKITSLVLLLFITYTSFAEERVPEQGGGERISHTFVIVHGASGGGWDWKTVAQLLTTKQHTVYRPTLTGLGEKHHLNHADINLTTHINDVVNLIVFEDLHNVVLVGHSYGGMVITGVMDRIPERIQHVTFLDAVVPDDGMSMVEGQVLAAELKVINGFIHFPWLDTSLPFPRDVVQSLHTFTEPVSYQNPEAFKLDVSYVAFIPKGMSIAKRAADPSWLRAKKRHWTMRTFEGNHVVYRTKPVAFTAMLEDTVDDRNTR